MRRTHIFATVLAAGCTGKISGFEPQHIISGAGGGGADMMTTDPMDPNPCTNTVTIGSSPIRRLSHLEYGYSLTDIFNDATMTPVIATQQATLVPDPVSLGFKNSATFLTVTDVLAQNYMDAAEQASITAVANLTKLLPCDPANGEQACADQFITTFGKKMYRRALTTEEVTAYQTVYSNARGAGYDFSTGIQWLVFTFLQAPGFLYRAELDTAGDPAVRPLSQQELAVRLSYLLWESVPDDTLYAAVDANQLSTKDQIKAQAQRMIADPKSARLFDYYSQWLSLDKLQTYSRDATIYPNLDPNLPTLLTQEVQQFVQGTVFDGDGKLSSLLAAPYTYVNAPLATHYGFAPVTGSQWQKAQWTTRRGGLFMLGGTLGVRDKSTRTSIVRRGAMVRTQVMCQVVPAPPPNVPPLGAIDANQTQADILAQHRQNSACSGCHNLLDPLGVTFEKIDAVGRDRTQDEKGNTLTTAGAVTNLSPTLDGPVADSMDLFGKFIQSDTVSNCFTTQFYRFTAGRQEETGDACSTWMLRQRFRSSGGDIKDLLVGVTQTDDFSNKSVSLP
jgi:hypothetical protein